MVSATEIEEGLLMMAADMKQSPKVDAKMVSRWVIYFEDWGPGAFIRACAAYVRGAAHTFFPAPGQLREVDAHAAEERATIAWEHVRSAIRRYGSEASFSSVDLGGDGAALWAVARMGAECIGMMTDADRSIRASEFRKLYAAALGGGFSLDYLAGRFETENAGKGLDVSGNPAFIGRPGGAPSLPGVRALGDGE